MDLFLFFIGILLIVGSATTTGLYAITLHHRRRTEELRVAEMSNQMKYHLMDKALDHNMLPPGIFRREDF
jgi:hypothetical protein